MEHVLYMDKHMKERFIERHDFFVTRIKEKVLSQFRDVEAETDKHLADVESLFRDHFDQSGDPSQIYDHLRDEQYEFYELFDNLRNQMIISSLAVCYHQWERDLRHFIERELSHTVEYENVLEHAWTKTNIGGIFEILRLFGWMVRDEEFFSDLDATRLVVNVHKHGKGRALSDLAKKHPEFLIEGYFKKPDGMRDLFLDADVLQVTEDQFSSLTGAVRLFWVRFPERLTLQIDS